MLILLTFLLGFTSLVTCGSSSRNHILFWNTTNPMFRLDHADHQRIRVNDGNMPGQYDQLHLICPDSTEQHVVYSVSRLEFETCRVNSPNARIVALCTRPELYTITFRAVSPTPGSPVFEPGKTYYLISTSSARDLYRKAGGYCSTHNMKMMFEVADNTAKIESVAAASKQVKEDLVIDDLDKKLSSQFQRQFSESSFNEEPKIEVLSSNILGSSSESLQVTEKPSAPTFVDQSQKSDSLINQSDDMIPMTSSYTSPTRVQRKYFGTVYHEPGRQSGQVRASEYLYYYTPRDMVHLKNIVNRHMKSIAKDTSEELQAAQMLTSSSPGFYSSFYILLLSSLIYICL